MDYVNLGLGIVIGCFLGGIAVFAFLGRKSDKSNEVELVRLQTQLEEQKKYAKEMQLRMNDADITGATIRNVSDLLVVIGEFGPCP
ncbi:MAG TPA: hypothetical protein EYO31_02520 [Phycisphaerales bacterium]|nr:hypothetical protein [Phycisphaerales bacterium]